MAAISASSGCLGERGTPGALRLSLGSCSASSSESSPFQHPQTPHCVFQRNPSPKSSLLEDPKISTSPRARTLMGETRREERVGAAGAKPRPNGQQLWAKPAAGRALWVPWARWGWAGRDPPPRAAGGTPGEFAPECARCKSRGLGELPGPEERAAWGWVRMRMHGLSRAAALAVKMGWIRSRRWQGQTVALIHKRDGWVGSWRHPWAGEAAASQQGHNSLRAENRSCKIHCIFSLFFFFPRRGWELTLGPAHRGNGQMRHLKPQAQSRN